jgi:TolB-like protein/Flp pilus assembly protein TadD
MKKARRSSVGAKKYPPGSFLGKIKKRKIITTLAAFFSGGWFVYEIVHWILVDHYHLPERLKDIAIVSILCAMFCTLSWRWFRGEGRKNRIKFEYVLIPIFVLIAGVINTNLIIHIEEKIEKPYGDTFHKSAWNNSVAVLPFVNMSGDKDQEYFCDGLTEELITKLSQIRELKVSARTSAFVFKDKRVDIRDVGEKLHVDNVLEGSVRKSGSRIRVSAQLINVSDGYHLWSETYDRDLSDVFAVQDEIAHSVANTLQVTLLGNDEVSLETENIDAYNCFLLGQYFYGRQTRESLENAVDYYEQAITLDSDYARAWVGLGAAYAFQAGLGYLHPKKGYAQARAAVQKALTLDKNLAYAYAVMGWIQMSGDWDWAGADTSYKKAISLEPNRGLVEAAQLAVALGRFDQGIALARRAAEINPISAQALSTLGFSLWYGGRLDDAIAVYRKILDLIPENPVAQGMIGMVYLTQSDPLAALAELEPVKDPYWRLPGLSMAYYSLGMEAESEAVLREFIENYQAGGAYNVAQTYAFRGEADRAFYWLDRAYDQHDGGMFLVMVDPFLKSLKTDPRYMVVMKKMRLPV